MQNELDRSTSRSLPRRVEEAYAAEVELERARWKAITAFVEFQSIGSASTASIPGPTT